MKFDSLRVTLGITCSLGAALMLFAACAATLGGDSIGVAGWCMVIALVAISFIIWSRIWHIIGGAVFPVFEALCILVVAFIVLNDIMHSVAASILTGAGVIAFVIWKKKL